MEFPPTEILAPVEVFSGLKKSGSQHTARQFRATDGVIRAFRQIDGSRFRAVSRRVSEQFGEETGKTDTIRERYLRVGSRCGRPRLPRTDAGSDVSPREACTYIHGGINSAVADVVDVENVLSRILSEVFGV